MIGLASSPDPRVTDLAQRYSPIENEYLAEFADHPRASRDLARLGSLVQRTRQLLADIEALQSTVRDVRLDALHDAVAANLPVYQQEAIEIAAVKAAGPAYQTFAAVDRRVRLLQRALDRHLTSHLAQRVGARHLPLLDDVRAEAEKHRATLEGFIGTLDRLDVNAIVAGLAAEIERNGYGASVAKGMDALAVTAGTPSKTQRVSASTSAHSGRLLQTPNHHGRRPERYRTRA